MDLGIDGKVALVTASSRGLGKAVARQLALEGARVAICSRSADAIASAKLELQQETSASVEAFVTDVTDENQVTNLVEQTLSAFGRLDILVTNAGGPSAGYVDDFAPADYSSAVKLNLMSTIHLCYAALPHMKSNRWGRIVAITSIAARQPADNLILSNTARAGVLGFMKSLSNQVATFGITANSVCPGFTHTERVEELAEAFAVSGRGSREDFYAQIESTVPMKRMGTPEEFANVVAFLASERASYVNGVALAIDGGQTRALF